MRGKCKINTLAFESICNLKNYSQILLDLNNQKIAVEEQEFYGIINSIDASKELMRINQKELVLKRKILSSVHVTADGTPRKIEYKESKGLWMTIMPDKSKLYGKTEEVLLNKLMGKYGLSTKNPSVNEVFKSAIDYKAKTENPKKKTIDKNWDDFNTYISSDFQKMDIQKVTKDYLKEYTQTMVNSLNPKKKAFYSYKGILNLIFEYALDKGIISVNPVPSIKNSVYMRSCNTVPVNAKDKIFSAEELEQLKAKINSRKTNSRYHGYYVSGYMILFAIETGMRMAELCSLKWSDVSDKFIHIHTQLLSKEIPEEHRAEYYLVPYTKDEKGISKGGRYFPINPAMRNVLAEVKEAQDKLNISSEYVFCTREGNWTTTEAYYNVLYRLCKSMGYSITNNHAFRMSLNSNVLIGKYHLEVNDRAKLLGHTPEVNLRHYTFENRDYLENAYDLMNRE